MPIQLELIENDHILLIRIAGDWKPQDIPPAKENVRKIFTQATNTVHAVVDLKGVSVSLPLLQASQQVIGGEPLPNSGQIAVVGVSFMMRMIAEPILKLAGGGDELTFFNSLDEAKNHLRRVIAKER